ncbi:hypothetical protein SprV_0301349400 [Sparganum proliferum]
MRQARDRQRESLALSGSNPGKSVANIFRHRSSSKRGHELPSLLNDNEVFLIDDTDEAELFSDCFAKHLNTASEPVHFIRSPSDRTLSTIDVSSDLIKKQITIDTRFPRRLPSQLPPVHCLPLVIAAERRLTCFLLEHQPDWFVGQRTGRLSTCNKTTTDSTGLLKYLHCNFWCATNVMF